jgi:two-component system OmpR family sensor kinase
MLFLVVIVLLGASFYYLLSSGEDQRKFQEVNRYKIISDTFLTSEKMGRNSPALKKLYKNFSLETVDPDDVREEIEKSGVTIFSGRSIYGKVRVFKTERSYYIFIQRYDYDLMLRDRHPGDYTYRFLLSIGGMLIAILLFMYMMVLKKLYPLKRLHRQIEQFAAGDLDVKIEAHGYDEIGRIAHSFDKAIKHIKQLISSKNLFMRNIMHELKTPITKGRIVVETIDDPVAKKVLVNAFERMNELIGDLAQIERITMYNFEPECAETTLEKVMQETEKMLMADPSAYEIKVLDRPLYTDSALLSLALKNLMDNGIKYGSDSFVRVNSGGNRIEVRSKGEPLKHDISYYTEPFSQEEKRNSGFGLGLYIVSNVLEKLGYCFRYRYDDKSGENVFEVIID